jgi:hypothetical protein
LLVNNSQEIVLNCNDYHQQLLKLLGGRYFQLYSSSG